MRKLSLIVGGLLIAAFVLPAVAEEYLNGIAWDEPPKVTPGEKDSDPPSDAVVLFDGTNLDAWNNGDKWKVEDGVATVRGGGISTKQEFGDCQLHIEWSSPDPPTGRGQGCGNSGVFLMGIYEVQVLDSYSSDTYHDGQAGAVYKQKPPAVNVMRKPGEWNSFDIFWTCPRFDESGELVSPAYITVMHNGVLIHNHLEVKGNTFYHRPPSYTAHGPKGPISLQDHGNPVRFRNIWVREFKPAHGVQARDPFIRDGDKETPIKSASNTPKVSGLVTLDGKPLSGGEVEFSADDKSASHRVKLNEDGRFTLQPKQMATATYTVTIKGKNDKEASVPAKFQSTATSGLQLQVQPGDNEMQIELASE